MRVRALVVGAAVLGALSLQACAGAPAQIVDYSPLRGAQDVSTVAPVRIAFDHAVDQQSVASRFHLSPAVEGTIRWLSPRELEYDHRALQTSTTYEIIIEPGYRDAAGNVYVLRHRWSFTTEPPPSFVGSSPTDGATRIDPADFLTLDFTRPMDTGSLRSAISFDPQVSFSVHVDPTDDRRTIVAPDSLLDPDTAYTLTVGTGALDADGNQLDHVRTVRFTTGSIGSLRDWIAFAALSASGSSGGIWIVNERGLPRQLLPSTLVQSFSWSPDGSAVVFQTGSGGWWLFRPGGHATALDFSGPWAAALDAGDGYAYVDDSGTLRRETPAGIREVVAENVGDAVVSPDGRRLAYSQPQTDGTTVIWGYDVGLRSHYVLAGEKGDVAGLAWAPDGTRLAYLLRGETGSSKLRVLGLSGSASTATVATGELSPPVWMRDSAHVVVEAAVKSGSGAVHKAFVINVAAPPTSLTLALALPADQDIEVADPVPSPDGHQIAFISANQVWLMNADGTRPTPLTRYDPDSFPYSCLMPAWTRS